MANKLKTQKFEIVPVKISDCPVEPNSCQLSINDARNFAFATQEISNDVNSENIKKSNTNRKTGSEKSKTKSILPKQEFNESPEKKENWLARNHECKQIKKQHLEPKPIPVNKIWNHK